MRAAVQIEVSLVSVLIHRSCHAPVCGIVELYLVKGSGGNLAVYEKASVGVEASHLILAPLDAHTVVAGLGHVYGPGDGLPRRVPGALAYGVVALLYGIGALTVVILGEVVAPVVGGEQSLGIGVGKVLTLHPYGLGVIVGLELTLGGGCVCLHDLLLGEL